MYSAEPERRISIFSISSGDRLSMLETGRDRFSVQQNLGVSATQSAQPDFRTADGDAGQTPQGFTDIQITELQQFLTCVNGFSGAVGFVIWAAFSLALRLAVRLSLFCWA
jgi:hypothetical protein